MKTDRELLEFAEKQAKNLFPNLILSGMTSCGYALRCASEAYAEAIKKTQIPRAYIVYKDLGYEGLVVQSLHSNKPSADAAAERYREESVQRIKLHYPLKPERWERDADVFIVEDQEIDWTAQDSAASIGEGMK